MHSMRKGRGRVEEEKGKYINVKRDKKVEYLEEVEEKMQKEGSVKERRGERQICERWETRG